MIDLELCCDSYDSALIAAEYGFKRIELCANLSEGGTTPSVGMIQKCASVKNIEVHAMIRLRPGGFMYSQSELEIMSRDIVAASIAGAKGVVFGCLDSSNKLDLHPTLFLAETALKLKLELTFHRAFDWTPDPLKTMEHLHLAGFTRILTSGSLTNVDAGIDPLKNLVDYAQKYPIQIMAGGGVNSGNAVRLSNLGISALHFTARKKITQNLPDGMGHDFEPDRQKIESILESLRKS